MRKKIFDILPPEKPERKKQFIEKEDFIEEEEIKLTDTPASKSQVKKGLLFILLVLVFVIALGFKISKAEIQIWPAIREVTFEAKITVDQDTESYAFGNDIIPGEIFEVEKSVSDNFVSTGKALIRAEGVIRLYNAYTTKSEVWLKGTRFVSSDGKLFKSKDRIHIPGAEIQNGKLNPSQVDVPVIAAEAGEEYNIGPSHFSIFVFRGTSRYTKFYGESFESMKGGGESPQVTEEDLERAEETLIDRIKLEVEKALEDKTARDFVFVKDIAEIEILEKVSLTKAGDEKDSFNFKVRAKGITLLFKKEDVESFVKNFILLQIVGDETIYEKNLKIDYTLDILDLDSGRVVLFLIFSAELYPKIDLVLLKKSLIGKSLKEAETFLEGQPEIINTEIKLWPFWVNSIPQKLDKIEIDYPLLIE